MKKVTSNFKVGEVYADFPSNEYSTAYFTFVSHNSDRSFFKFIGGGNCYLQDKDGLYQFYYPSEFWKLSTEETNDLVAKGVIKL